MGSTGSPDVLSTLPFGVGGGSSSSEFIVWLTAARLGAGGVSRGPTKSGHFVRQPEAPSWQQVTPTYVAAAVHRRDWKIR